MLFKTSGLEGRNYGLSFYRIEKNGTETLILNEYNPGTSKYIEVKSAHFYPPLQSRP